jgi:hypothetical protein
MGKTGIGKQRAKYLLHKVYSIKNGEKKEIYEGEDGRLKKHHVLGLNDIVNNNMFPHDISLEFTTPVRIKYKGHFTNKLDFHIIIRSLLRACVKITSHFRRTDSIVPAG